MDGTNKENYLLSGNYVDCDHPAVVDFAKTECGDSQDPVQQVICLYYAVRDQVKYTAYLNFSEPKNYTASGALLAGQGWCVSKSALLVACARVIGVPARCGYADVVNHLTTAKLQAAMGGSKVFHWHSYSDLFLQGRWVKATPAFNLSLCERAGLKPLEFDGVHDSMFHEFDQSGHKHMEYLQDRGCYADVPFSLILETFREHYGSSFLSAAGAVQFEQDVYGEGT